MGFTFALVGVAAAAVATGADSDADADADADARDERETRGPAMLGIPIASYILLDITLYSSPSSASSSPFSSSCSSSASPLLSSVPFRFAFALRFNSLVSELFDV